MNEAQVLSQRLIQHGEYLPTLCASYTAQHLLQRDHIAAKGLFANLVQRDDKFCFIDPFVFVTPFGTTDSIVLPTDSFAWLSINWVMLFRRYTPLLGFWLELKE